MNTVTRLERGWPGHGLFGFDYTFRRNTLLTLNDNLSIVVSTIGCRIDRHNNNKVLYVEGSTDRYETKVFYTEVVDFGGYPYIEANLANQINISQRSTLKDSDEYNALEGPDMIANTMHESIVEEMVKRLQTDTL